MNPKISVIVPVYKTEKYLHRCVDSILAQTFTDFELLLIDDGSPDNCGLICNEYATKDSRVQVFHKENQGAGLARKFGVEKAEGERIVFVDSDDTIPAKALESLLIDSDNGKYDLVVGTFINDKGYTYRHHVTGIVDREEYIKALLSDTTMIGPVVKLYKKSIFDRCRWNTDKRIIQNEDLLMLLDYAVYVDKVYISNDNICYKQYVRKNSISQSAIMSSEGWFLLFDRMDEVVDFIKTDNIRWRIFLNKYKLRRIYIYIFSKTLKIDTCSNTIKRILAEENTYKNNLVGIEHDALCMLKSKFRRNLYYFKLKNIAVIKTVLENVGLLQLYYKIRYKNIQS